jgi:Domain of unknown function (DUF389)
MTVALIIAGIGVPLDQPILIVGSMVVGPEFGPLAALCVGLVQRKFALVRSSALALGVGFQFGMILTVLAVWLLTSFGVVDKAMLLDERPLTDFIRLPLVDLGDGGHSRGRSDLGDHGARCGKGCGCSRLRRRRRSRRLSLAADHQRRSDHRCRSADVARAAGRLDVVTPSPLNTPTASSTGATSGLTAVPASAGTPSCDVASF